jgi:hypothetical protein
VLAGVFVADRVTGQVQGGLLAGATTLVVYLATTVFWVLPRWRAARAALDEPGEGTHPELAAAAAAPASPGARPRGTTP